MLTLSLVLGLAGLMLTASRSGAGKAPGKGSSRAPKDPKDARDPRDERLQRRAQELIQKGDAAWQRALWAQALQLYQQAYDVKPLPAIQRHIADCHRGMGNAGRAAFAYRQYLKYAGEVADRREVEELAVRMEQLAAETRGGLAPDPAPAAGDAPADREGARDAQGAPAGKDVGKEPGKEPGKDPAAKDGRSRPTSRTSRPHRSRSSRSRASRSVQHL